MREHRIEHCQMAREDQLDKMQKLGVTPSFFVGHVYYWGDRHRDIFIGPERAARISPLRSAVDRGIRFTIHDDTPITPVNPLQLSLGFSQSPDHQRQSLGPRTKNYASPGTAGSNNRRGMAKFRRKYQRLDRTRQVR